MTLSTTSPRIDYTGTGTLATYSFPFRIFQAADLTVIKVDTGGTETTLTLTTDYSVTGVGAYTGGSITLTAGNLPTGYTLTIKRVVALTQPTSIRDQTAFYAAVHEDVFDRLTMIDQQHEESLGRAPVLPGSTTPPGPMPPPTEGTVLGWVSGKWAWLAAATADLAANLVNTSNTSLGDALVGVLGSLPGEVGTTQHNRNDEKISVFRWMSAAQIADVMAGTAASNFAAALDCGAAIQAAYDAVNTIALGTAVDGLGTFNLGGAKLWFPRGAYKTTIGLETYKNIESIGDGRWASVIYSNYNGPIIRNHLPDSNYNVYGIGFKSMSFVGDRTKTSQTGIALMRAWLPAIHEVSVLNCGNNGVHLFQNVLHDLRNVEVQKCVGYGIVLDQGYTDWTLATPNNLPTIDGRCENGHFGFNDKPGVRLQGYHDSNQFIGGSSEQNNQQTAHVGYQIESVGVSVWPDEFIDFSCESGNGFAHIYMNLSSVSSVLRFTRFHHSAVSGGTLDRCAHAVQGKLIMDRPYGNAQAYRSLGGFTTPFQITKATSTIRIHEPIGSGVTNGVWVNDETNAVTGLNGNVFLTSREYTYGYNLHRTEFGQLAQDYQLDTEANPWLSLQSFYRAIAFGAGSAAYDTYLQRTGTRTLGMGTQGGSQFFDQGSVWNSNHALMGGYHLWVDGSGRLRIKSGAPASDTDGTVVGTQT